MKRKLSGGTTDIQTLHEPHRSFTVFDHTSRLSREENFEDCMSSQSKDSSSLSHLQMRVEGHRRPGHYGAFAGDSWAGQGWE